MIEAWTLVSLALEEDCFPVGFSCVLWKARLLTPSLQSSSIGVPFALIM